VPRPSVGPELCQDCRRERRLARDTREIRVHMCRAPHPGNDGRDVRVRQDELERAPRAGHRVGSPRDAVDAIEVFR
jgi:hypothetical protein